MTTSSPLTLESLPAGMSSNRHQTKCTKQHLPTPKPTTEIEIQILCSAPNIDTLRSLVHSLPVMHRLYVKARQHIFTTATFNDLSSRNVHLLPLPHAMGVYVENIDHALFDKLQSALTNLYDQRQKGLSRIRLSIEDRGTLRFVSPINRIVPFEITQYPFPLFSFHVSPKYITQIYSSSSHPMTRLQKSRS